MNDIKLKIYAPDGIVKDASVFRVVIPAWEGNLTIIKDRAPTSVVLASGAIQILDAGNKVLENIFIKGGVADIAQDVCNISAEKVLLESEVSTASLKALIENETTSEAEPSS